MIEFSLGSSMEKFTFQLTTLFKTAEWFCFELLRLPYDGPWLEEIAFRSVIRNADVRQILSQFSELIPCDLFMRRK